MHTSSMSKPTSVFLAMQTTTSEMACEPTAMIWTMTMSHQYAEYPINQGLLEADMGPDDLQEDLIPRRHGLPVDRLSDPPLPFRRRSPIDLP